MIRFYYWWILYWENLYYKRIKLSKYWFFITNVGNWLHNELIRIGYLFNFILSEEGMLPWCIDASVHGKSELSNFACFYIPIFCKNVAYVCSVSENTNPNPLFPWFYSKGIKGRNEFLYFELKGSMGIDCDKLIIMIYLHILTSHGANVQ